MICVGEEDKKNAKRWAEDYIATHTYIDDPLQYSIAKLTLHGASLRTMSDIKWDEDTHSGMGATDANGDLWVMMNEDDDNYIEALDPECFDTMMIIKSDLTPTYDHYRVAKDLWKDS